jgi:hypothetical protein
MTERLRRAATRWSWLLALAASLALLVRLGHGPLSRPPVSHITQLGAWLN